MQGRGRSCKGIRRKSSRKVSHSHSYGFSDPPRVLKEAIELLCPCDVVLSFYLLLGQSEQVREGRRNLLLFGG